MGFAYKKGVKVKKKPKNVSKYIDFANQLESNQIEVPTIQQNTQNSISTTPSEIINYFYSLTINIPPVPTVPLLVYLFTKNAHVGNLYMEIRDIVQTNAPELHFRVYIVRGTSVLLNYTIDYVGGVASKDLNFGDAVFKQGDQIQITLDSGSATNGDRYEIRVKGTVTL
jgi:hypothetical protein